MEDRILEYEARPNRWQQWLSGKRFGKWSIVCYVLGGALPNLLLTVNYTGFQIPDTVVWMPLSPFLAPYYEAASLLGICLGLFGLKQDRAKTWSAVGAITNGLSFLLYPLLWIYLLLSWRVPHA